MLSNRCELHFQSATMPMAVVAVCFAHAIMIVAEWFLNDLGEHLQRCVKSDDHVEHVLRRIPLIHARTR